MNKIIDALIDRLWARIEQRLAERIETDGPALLEKWGKKLEDWLGKKF